MFLSFFLSFRSFDGLNDGSLTLPILRYIICYKNLFFSSSRELLRKITVAKGPELYDRIIKIKAIYSEARQFTNNNNSNNLTNIFFLYIYMINIQCFHVIFNAVNENTYLSNSS